MALAAEKTLEHIGETHGVADHDHDLMGFSTHPTENLR